MLKQVVNVAVPLKLIAKKDLATAIVDSIIAHKAVTDTTNSKMLETAGL